MRCSFGTTFFSGIFAVVLIAAPTVLRADTIRYFDGGNFGVVSQTLSGLGYNTSDSAIESTAQGFTVPGAAGDVARLDFTFVRDLGGYQFSFGVFDRSAVTADPVSDRQNWALQALGTATVVFDNREIDIGATNSINVAAGTELGLFLIPNDTLQAVLNDPSAFYGGIRPDPLFSVSDANPGSFDQLLSFEAGGLHTFAFEDLTRAGGSDQDFNDLVVTMTATLLSEELSIQTEISAPSGLAIGLLGGLFLVWVRTGTRNRARRRV
jgi:hypothetical protein